MKTKIFLVLLVLYIGFSDLIGELFNKQYYQEPEKWLINTFGVKTVTNSLNFYVQNNGWSQGNQSAMSITNDYLYLVEPKKNIFQVYEFKPIKISLRECKELSSAVNILTSKIDGNEIDPSFLKGAWVGGFDGPTLTLVKFERDHTITKRWSREDSPANETVYVAYKVYEIASGCKSS